MRKQRSSAADRRPTRQERARGVEGVGVREISGYVEQGARAAGCSGFAHSTAAPEFRAAAETSERR